MSYFGSYFGTYFGSYFGDTGGAAVRGGSWNSTEADRRRERDRQAADAQRRYLRRLREAEEEQERIWREQKRYDAEVAARAQALTDMVLQLRAQHEAQLHKEDEEIAILLLAA